MEYSAEEIAQIIEEEIDVILLEGKFIDALKKKLAAVKDAGGASALAKQLLQVANSKSKEVKALATQGMHALAAKVPGAVPDIQKQIELHKKTGGKSSAKKIKTFSPKAIANTNMLNKKEALALLQGAMKNGAVAPKFNTHRHQLMLYQYVTSLFQIDGSDL